MKTLLIFFVFINLYAIDIVNLKIKQHNIIKIIRFNTLYNTKQILIKYNTITPELLNDIESRYNLQFDQRLITGDYIYTIKKGDLLNILNSLVYENNIIKVLPLFNKIVQTY